MAANLTSLSSYPQGFTHPVAIRGVPILNMHAGNVFFVDSNTGADAGGNDGTRNRPFATWDYANGRCAANNGDIIALLPGHAETISAAGGVTMDVAGVSVIGLGEGDSRPIITFSDTASTVVVSAASVTVENIIVKPSVDSVVTAFSVQASDCHLDFTVEDASDTVEFVRGVLTTAAGDDLFCKIHYLGRTGGNACVNAVRLVGTNRARIILDAYGIFSTAAVEFVTTACSDVNVSGYVYNSGTTDGSKLVVDTITGSTWFADIHDGGAGARYSGGSGAALAADDISTIAGYHTVPSADAVTNSQMRDVVGNKTDAAAAGAVSATESVMAYAKQIVTGLIVVDEYHDVPTPDAVANAQMNEVIGNKTDTAVLDVSATASLVASLKGLMSSTVRTATKTGGTFTSTADALFTVAGGPVHVLSLVGIVTTESQGQANDLKIQAAVTDPSGDVDMSTAVEINGDAIGTLYTFLGPTGILTPTTAGLAILDQGHATLAPTQWIVPPGDIEAIGVQASHTGDATWSIAYIPLSPSATLVAAA